MDHIEITFTLDPREPFAEILTAQLADIGFDTFVDTEDGIKAYILEGNFKETMLSEISILETAGLKHTCKTERIAKKNWNEEWEKNFDRVEVGDQLLIRAPFHAPSNKFTYEIVIEPKMSFGTGHHDTTFLMAQQLMKLDVKGKSVLDMGCGTGILAILASKLGAATVKAIDIEEWAFLNTKENAERNKTINISVEKGDVNLLAGNSFQLILANINKNVLIKDIGLYTSSLTKGGELLISGFFESDCQELESKFKAQGLLLKEKVVRTNWALMHFTN